jgi:Zn-dependent protease/predicted transcriptional regulator
VNTSFRIARVMGIPVLVNLSWFLILIFVTSYLALNIYPNAAFEAGSPYHNDRVLHWAMAIASGMVFFGSILLHEMAHSIVALLQGIPVKSITLFMFGGVSEITGDPRRPRHEFLMAVVGPLTSLLIAGVFLVAWFLTGFADHTPVGIVVQWLFVMNLALALFNMAPGFPMDGGRVLRSIVWGITGNSIRATRVATLSGRSIGYSLMIIGALAFFGMLQDWDIMPINGILFVFLGLYLENAARQSWFQALAIDVLTNHAAEDIMNEDLEVASLDDRLHYLADRGGRRYMFFINDRDDHVAGIVTHREVAAIPELERSATSAGKVMVPTETIPVAMPREDGASLLKRMEADGTWHMPVVSDGRVVGVVSKEDLLRLLAARFFPRETLRGQR